VLFLEADDNTIVRRFSETRRPHPLGTGDSVLRSVRRERRLLAPIRNMAGHTINTAKFNVHELRELISEKFRGDREQSRIMVQVISFGYRYGVPLDSDLVFDVRFLPNPNYIPEFKKLSGRHPGVARYIRSFPQTLECIDRISQLLVYLLPHYIREGKSYLTIAFGCTGDHGHKFGLPQPVDASESVLPRLASLKVQTISIDGQTGDFVRRNGIRLQQIHTHGFAINARHRTDRLDAEPLPLQVCKVVHFPRPQQVSAPPPFQSRCRL
jgi:hypothetical protein